MDFKDTQDFKSLWSTVHGNSAVISALIDKLDKLECFINSLKSCRESDLQDKLNNPDYCTQIRELREELKRKESVIVLLRKNEKFYITKLQEAQEYMRGLVTWDDGH